MTVAATVSSRKKCVIKDAVPDKIAFEMHNILQNGFTLH
jgi:hypothetical protein